MIAYTTLGANDLAKSVDFYTNLLAELGAKKLIDMDRIVFFGTQTGAPMLAICKPYDGQASKPGNGTMVTIAAGSKENVDKMHAKALALGATCDGPPGQRIPDVFYGAYFRDLDGNKLAFCHFG